MRRQIDTNILIYAFGEGAKAEVAMAVLAARPVVSVQALNAFARNARRKLGMTWEETNAALAIIADAAIEIVPVTLDMHRTGVHLTERYKLNIFDGIMLAAGLASGCEVFWSEDMHHGLVVNGSLHVANPFVLFN